MCHANVWHPIDGTTITDLSDGRFCFASIIVLMLTDCNMRSFDVQFSPINSSSPERRGRPEKCLTLSS